MSVGPRVLHPYEQHIAGRIAGHKAYIRTQVIFAVALGKHVHVYGAGVALCPGGQCPDLPKGDYL